MANINLKYISEFSTLSTPERNAVLNWLSNQSEEIRLIVFKRHADLIHQKRAPGEHLSPELSYSLLLLAAKQQRIELTALSFKRDLSIAQTEDISRLKIGNRPAKKKKGGKKLNRIRKEFFPMITLLRDSYNYSWNDVVIFLQREYAVSISKAYIQIAYKKLLSEVTYV